MEDHRLRVMSYKPLTHRIHGCYIYIYIHMVKCTINIPQMLAYIPYMDPMGYYLGSSFSSATVRYQQLTPEKAFMRERAAFSGKRAKSPSRHTWVGYRGLSRCAKHIAKKKNTLPPRNSPQIDQGRWSWSYHLI